MRSPVDVQLRLCAGLAIAVTLSGCGIGRSGVLDLSWTAPTQNTDGSPVADITSYRVYYGTTPSPCPGGTYITVSNPPGGAGQKVTTRLTKLAVGELYYVSIAAVTSSGVQSTCSTAASNRAHSAD
jgi:hypothetical protein